MGLSIHKTSRRRGATAAEFKERAVRMVHQLREETGHKQGTITRVADQVGCGVESLRTWVKQGEVDAGHRPGTTSENATGSLTGAPEAQSQTP